MCTLFRPFLRSALGYMGTLYAKMAGRFAKLFWLLFCFLRLQICRSLICIPKIPHTFFKMKNKGIKLFA